MRPSKRQTIKGGSMMKSCSCGICCVVGTIAAIGALNWGLVAGFNFNLVSKIAGSGTTAERVIYIVVGLAGAMKLLSCVIKCPCNKDKGTCAK